MLILLLISYFLLESIVLENSKRSVLKALAWDVELRSIERIDSATRR